MTGWTFDSGKRRQHGFGIVVGTLFRGVVGGLITNIQLGFGITSASVSSRALLLRRIGRRRVRYGRC